MGWAGPGDKLSSWEGIQVMLRMVWPSHYLGWRTDAPWIWMKRGQADCESLPGRWDVETTPWGIQVYCTHDIRFMSNVLHWPSEKQQRWPFGEYRRDTGQHTKAHHVSLALACYFPILFCTFHFWGKSGLACCNRLTESCESSYSSCGVEGEHDLKTPRISSFTFLSTWTQEACRKKKQKTSGNHKELGILLIDGSAYPRYS